MKSLSSPYTQSTFPYSFPSSTASIFSPFCPPISNSTVPSTPPAPDPDALMRVFSAMVENCLMPALVCLKSFVSVLDTCASTMSSSAESQEAELYRVSRSCSVWLRATMMWKRRTQIDKKSVALEALYA